MVDSRRRKAFSILLLLLQIVLAIGFGILVFAHWDEATRWSQSGFRPSRTPRIAFEWVFCVFNGVLTAFMLLLICLVAWVLLRGGSIGRILRIAPVTFLVTAAIGLFSVLLVPDVGDHHIDLGRGLPGLALLVVSITASATTAALNRLLG